MFKVTILTGLLLSSPSFAGQSLEIENSSDTDIVALFYSRACKSTALYLCGLQLEFIHSKKSYTYIDPFDDDERQLTIFRADNANAHVPVPASLYSKCVVIGSGEKLAVGCKTL